MEYETTEFVRVLTISNVCETEDIYTQNRARRLTFITCELTALVWLSPEQKTTSRLAFFMIDLGSPENPGLGGLGPEKDELANWEVFESSRANPGSFDCQQLAPLAFGTERCTHAHPGSG